MVKNPLIHPTALISPSAKIGKGTKIWAFSQIMDHARIGKNCVIGNGVYVDRRVKIGDNVKVHNKACLYDGLVVEDNVFIGPHVVFTNDKNPRHNYTRSLRRVNWRVKEGASIGAGALILPDTSIGSRAMVGAGAVVTKDVPEHGLVCGNPARLAGFVCACGRRLTRFEEKKETVSGKCGGCGKRITIRRKIYEQARNGPRTFRIFKNEF